MIFDRRNRATVLRQRVDALMSDQLAVRAELAYIRETLLPGIVSEHDEAFAALQRRLESYTGHQV